MKTKVSAHIQDIPENGPDLFHFDRLHWDFFIQLGLKNKWKAQWETGKGEKEHIGLLSVEQSTTFFNFEIPGSKVYTKIEQIGPGIVFLVIDLPLGRIILQEFVTPIGPLLQQMDLAFWSDCYIPRFIVKLASYAYYKQLCTDMAVWNNKTFRPQPLFVKKEGTLVQYRRWFSQFYSEHSPKLSEIEKNSLEW